VIPHYHMNSRIGHMTNNVDYWAAAVPAMLRGPGPTEEIMLEPLLESQAKEKILLYLYTHAESYPREIARDLRLYVNTVQYQLLKLEKGGVLYSRLRGKVRLVGIDPRYAFRKELEALLAKVLSFVPESERERLYRPRLRPRRTGKPIRGAVSEGNKGKRPAGRAGRK
jgi:DNA-binding transcriptional ArsR family regulator